MAEYYPVLYDLAMDAPQNLAASHATVASPSRLRVLFSAARYLFGKVLTIAITIFVGVFLTILMVSYPVEDETSNDSSPFETRLLTQITDFIQVSIYRGTIRTDAYGTPDQEQVDAITKELREEAGLNLPLLPRYLLWTRKALAFDWGRLDVTPVAPANVRGDPAASGSNTIVLQYLPNTLLLVGTAYLLVFLLGMPLSLYLARNYGNWVDKVFSFLSPISSVPSWVFAILLIALFAVQLRWLPVGKMYEFHRPENSFLYALEVARHMVLPVLAIVLSLLFQIIYIWRTFFIIYSEEDYVELAQAKGLPHRMLEQQHILKPALPYVITSLATTLIGFWQLTIALEKIFQWPGIGWLYLDALPNFWGEHRAIGDLMIVVQIVVTFAYVLGILVFILDLVYVIVDPRIHLIPSSNPARVKVKRKRGLPGREALRSAWMKRKDSAPAQPDRGPAAKRAVSFETFLRDRRESLREFSAQSSFFFRELRRYPSAIFGLTIILLMLAGSIYAVTALPYEEFGRAYDADRVKGENIAPRTAAPKWLNLFSVTPRLSTLILDENSPQVSTTRQTLENGWVEKTTIFKFDYGYRNFPSDVFLYLDSTYQQKMPFVSMIWTTPDGRSIDLKAKSVSGSLNYDFGTGLSAAQQLKRNPEWKHWFVTEGQYPTPAYQLLFAAPGSEEPVPLKGTYQLEITSLLFEPDSDLQPQIVLLGQVYGMAGTDYWRRDLVVPLLWGMPFTLIIGFLGTLVTLLTALLLPAIGVWYGGWLDSFIQRLTEVNMVVPGLAIAVLANALYNVHIWIVLGIVVLLNAFGAPIKTFRSALLQAKEAPYIEMARSYGASNPRIIIHYLVPRILPVLIPQLVTLVPSFIFLEATLGLFNIKSEYPSWGRIIYDGLARGALYGSPFWVLEPILLLLLTGFAFAMLGSALERILNPRIIADVPVTSDKSKAKDRSVKRTRQLTAGAIAVLFMAIVLIPSIRGKTLASVIIDYIDQTIKYDPRITQSSAPIFTRTPRLTPSSTNVALSFTTTPTLTPTLTATITPAVIASLTPDSSGTPLTTYTLHAGEYPYCIARRLDIDPQELLALNGLVGTPTFSSGTVLQLPQSAKPFPGERQLRSHPRRYTVATSTETLYTIACQFGDLTPEAIAQANQIPVDSALSIGQRLNIP